MDNSSVNDKAPTLGIRKRLAALGLILGTAFIVAAMSSTSQAVTTSKTPDVSKLEKLTGHKVIDVRPTAIPDMFEARIDNKVTYIDKTGEFIITGNMFRLEDSKNLTQDRLEEIRKVDWNELPHASGIKITQGTPKLKFAVFTDPDCPYCRKLQAHMDKMKDVEITILPMPIEGLHPGATFKTQVVMCSKDKAKAWKIAANGGEAPYADGCDTGIDKVSAFAKSHNIEGTPYIVAANGKGKTGFTNGEELDAWLQKNMK